MDRRNIFKLYQNVQMPSRSVSCFMVIICRTGTGLKTMIISCNPDRGVLHWDICILYKMKCVRSNKRLSVKTAKIISLGFSVSIKFLRRCAAGRRHGLRINITKRIPSVTVYMDVAYRSLRNFRININLVGAIRPRFFRPRPPPSALHRITNLYPFRQSPHRQQIDEHQRRHQNG